MKTENLKSKMQKTLDYLENELAKLRGSRASTELVADIKVKVYDSEMLMSQLGNISVVDATLITVQVYDKSIIAEVEKAIRSTDLGLNPVVDGSLIRIPLPPLSQERREEFVKLVKQKVEESKIALRKIRHDAMEQFEKEKKDGVLREDELEHDKNELQKLVDEFNKKFDSLFEKKSSELMKV